MVIIYTSFAQTSVQLHCIYGGDTYGSTNQLCSNFMQLPCVYGGSTHSITNELLSNFPHAQCVTTTRLLRSASTCVKIIGKMTYRSLIN